MDSMEAAQTVERYAEAADAAAATDLDALTDGELDAETVGLLRTRHRLDAEIARRVHRWDRRMVWIADGSRSPAARLARDGRLAGPTATRVVRHARAVASMPATQRAWAAGDLGDDHVALLAAAAGAGRDELFARDESMLVGQCETLLHRQATKVVQYWCQRADAELRSDGTPPPPPTSLRLSTTFGGAVTGDFVLDPIGGATVAESLRRIERELYRRDQRESVIRTKPERMAAALVEMAIRAHSVPKKARRPEPLIAILAGEATLDHICELATGTVLAPGLVVPHLSRADVQTFVFDGADRVLVASKQRTFRGMLRRAIQVRDRHCRHKSGCDAPITECDINHVTAHAQGGETTERGGDLQCEPHNRKSDLHDRAPADVLEAARERRHQEALIDQRIAALIAQRESLPPPEAA